MRIVARTVGPLPPRVCAACSMRPSRSISRMPRSPAPLPRGGARGQRLRPSGVCSRSERTNLRRRIVNLADPERLFPTRSASVGQHNRRAKEFPDPSRRATDPTRIPRPLKLTTPVSSFIDQGPGSRHPESPALPFEDLREFRSQFEATQEEDQAAALTTIDSPRAQTVASYLMRAAPCRSLEDMDARLIATGHRSPAGQPGRRVERRVASSSLGRCHY